MSVQLECASPVVCARGGGLCQSGRRGLLPVPAALSRHAVPRRGALSSIDGERGAFEDMGVSR